MLTTYAQKMTQSRNAIVLTSSAPLRLNIAVPRPVSAAQREQEHDRDRGQAQGRDGRPDQDVAALVARLIAPGLHGGHDHREPQLVDHDQQQYGAAARSRTAAPMRGCTGRRRPGSTS